MRISRPHLLAAIFLTAAILAGVCIRAPRMYPLHAESSANFWYALTRVDLGASRTSQDMIAFDRDRFIYDSQYPFYTFPDNPYMSITETEAAVDFPRVKMELARRATLNEPDDYIARGYARWNAIAEEDQSGVRGLMQCIEAARLDWIASRPWPYLPSTQVSDFKQGLVHVSQAARLYWVCIAFEAIYLSGIVWFAFRPYIRHASIRRKLLHVAALPFLLILPYWFGYCNSASPAFPLGGILYPYIGCLGFFQNFRWEYEFLVNLPPFFSVITQGRVVTFADYFSLQEALPYQPGPVNVAFLSLVSTAIIGAGHFAFYAWRKFRHRHRGQGFPVLDVHPIDIPSTPK